MRCIFAIAEPNSQLIWTAVSEIETGIEWRLTSKILASLRITCGATAAFIQETVWPSRSSQAKSFLLVLIFALTPVMWAQEQPAQTPPGPGVGDQMRPEHRQQMMEMHKQEMEAMKADMERMRSSLAQMKANVLTIKDANEMARWRNNVDMWETLVGHMERMQKHMESMGPGMMQGPGMGGTPPSPSTEKKPE